MRRSAGDDTPLRDLEEEGSTGFVGWKLFFVILAGKTKDAHLTIVEKLKSSGQTEVESPEGSDYLLVFCPIASRVGTDIGEALQSVPDGKPIILVVMHHTFDSQHTVAESHKQVNNQNVRLTVDYLFYEGKLLTCSRNDIAWSEIKKLLGVSGSQVSSWQICKNLCKWLWDYRMLAGVTLAFFTFILMRRSERAVTDPTA